jgi:sugar phosphate isomerase/epimerase
MKLSLDHITVTDTTPMELVEVAAATGCAGICPFLHSMAVLPAMPSYDLAQDRIARRETRAALDAAGIVVDLVYPFTVTGRTTIADFTGLLAVGAELGAPLANVLCYDRDPIRRSEKLAELAELAASFSIELAIEFYPPSQIRTLADAVEEIGRTGRTDVGVTLDLLHTMRGGAVADSIALLKDRRIRIAQIADGPRTGRPAFNACCQARASSTSGRSCTRSIRRSLSAWKFPNKLGSRLACQYLIAPVRRSKLPVHALSQATRDDGAESIKRDQAVCDAFRPKIAWALISTKLRPHNTSPSPDACLLDARSSAYGVSS